MPIATFTGWNLRTAAWGADGMLTRWMGSYLEFARTAADRRASGDPRPSVHERYPTREAYLARFEQAVRQLRDDRFLLEDDAASLLRAAGQRELW